MTDYAHRGWTQSHMPGAVLLLGRALQRGVKRLQYGQMISVLNRLPESRLKDAGLRRRDIPDHARRAIYGGH